MNNLDEYGRIPQICEYCGNPFFASRAKKYCCEDCRRKAAHKKEIKRISNRTYRADKIKLEVISVFEHKCAICGWQASEKLHIDTRKKQNVHYAFGNEIHHIIPVSEGGEDIPRNLIMLCPNHHKQADMGILKRVELLEYIKHLLPEAEYLDAKAEYEALDKADEIRTEKLSAEKVRHMFQLLWR